MKLVPMRKNPFALVGNLESKEVRSCWGFRRQTKGIVGNIKWVREHLYVQNVGWFKKSYRLSKRLKFTVVI